MNNLEKTTYLGAMEVHSLLVRANVEPLPASAAHPSFESLYPEYSLENIMEQLAPRKPAVPQQLGLSGQENQGVLQDRSQPPLLIRFDTIEGSDNQTGGFQNRIRTATQETRAYNKVATLTYKSISNLVSWGADLRPDKPITQRSSHLSSVETATASRSVINSNLGRQAAAVVVAIAALPFTYNIGSRIASTEVPQKTLSAQTNQNLSFRRTAGSTAVPVLPNIEFATTSSTELKIAAGDKEVTTSVPAQEDAPILLPDPVIALKSQKEAEPLAEEARPKSVEELYESLCGSSLVTSEFGLRWGTLHAGTDLGCENGADIKPLMGGTVIYADWMGAYGNLIEIDHGNGLVTRYAHAQQINVSVGDVIGKDTVLGLVGATGGGNITGPHLHFETRVNGVPLNSRDVLKDLKL